MRVLCKVHQSTFTPGIKFFLLKLVNQEWVGVTLRELAMDAWALEQCFRFSKVIFCRQVNFLHHLSQSILAKHLNEPFWIALLTLYEFSTSI